MSRVLSLFGLLFMVVSFALGDSVPAKRFCRPNYAITTCQVTPDNCFSDDFCSGTKRCCQHGCGRTCQNTTLVQCPRIDQDVCPVEKCFSLGGYAWDADGCPVCACNRCPADKPPQQCPNDPCRGAQCPAYPNAKCVPNYCGGCHADFFVDGLRIECGQTAKRGFCLPTYAITTCHVTSDNCLSDDFCSGTERCCPHGCGRTCQNTTLVQCPRIDQGICPVKKCFSLGGYARDADGCPVCACNRCPADKPPEKCLPDPCLGAQCPAYPNAKCVPNYCGGCHADFFVDSLRVDCGHNNPTTETVHPGVCRLRNGSEVSAGASWFDGPCMPCRCDKGRVFCAVMDCAPPPCANPVRPEGQCCHVCPVTGVKCSANEILSNRSRPFCEPTCKERSPPKGCLTSDDDGPFQRGCVCRSSYVRRRRFGRCIQTDECPDERSCAAVLCKQPLRCRVLRGQARCDDFCYPNRCERGRTCREEPLQCLVPPCPTVVKCTRSSTEPSTPVWWILLRRWLYSLLHGSRSG